MTLNNQHVNLNKLATGLIFCCQLIGSAPLSLLNQNLLYTWNSIDMVVWLGYHWLLHTVYSPIEAHLQYRHPPLLDSPVQVTLHVFINNSAIMVRFSFCKKPLEGENTLYNLIAPPKGLLKYPVLLLENLRYVKSSLLGL